MRCAEKLAEYVEILGDLTSCPGVGCDIFIQSIWHNPLADAIVDGISEGTEFLLTTVQISACFGRHRVVAQLLCS